MPADERLRPDDRQNL